MNQDQISQLVNEDEESQLIPLNSGKQQAFNQNEISLFQSEKSESKIEIQEELPKKRKKKKRKKDINFITKITQVFEVYLKLMMGRELTEEETHSFEAYLDSIPQKKQHKSDHHPLTKVFTKQIEYINEFDCNMGDIILSFPNPDYEDLESYKDLKPIEAIEILRQAFFQDAAKSEWESLDSLLLFKAVEKAYLLLMKKHDFKKMNSMKKKNKENEQEFKRQDGLKFEFKFGKEEEKEEILTPSEDSPKKNESNQDQQESQEKSHEKSKERSPQNILDFVEGDKHLSLYFKRK